MEDAPDKETLDKWSSDPANWKLGFIYYNKQDKRLFPPKREGDGWGLTINFGNPRSIYFILFLIVFPIVLSIVLRRVG